VIPAVRSIRPRTNAAFAGSLTSGPNGVRLPIVSPDNTAANASVNFRRAGGVTHHDHAIARSAKRSPPSARITGNPQRTRLICAVISSGSTPHSCQTSAATPSTAASVPIAIRRPREEDAGTPAII
jgi:hypothetical protein